MKELGFVMEPEPGNPENGATAPETEREWGRETEEARERPAAAVLIGTEAPLGVDESTAEAGGGAVLDTTLHIFRHIIVRSAFTLLFN